MEYGRSREEKKSDSCLMRVKREDREIHSQWRNPNSFADKENRPKREGPIESKGKMGEREDALGFVHCEAEGEKGGKRGEWKDCLHG